jgi:hypothetical protein
MVGFTAAQILHAQATVLDHHIKGPLFHNNIQAKPLLAKMEASPKTFPGGKELITMGVRFNTGANGVNDGVTGYSHLDPVGFYNPGNGLRASYVWREHHLGATISETQLKQQGIKVADNPDRTLGAPRMAEILAPVLDEMSADIAEQYAITMNALMWGDGTADSNALHGLTSFITDIPTIGVTGGLSRVTYTPWRNFAFTAAFAAHGSFDANWGGAPIASAATGGGVLIQALQKLHRQLTRRGASYDCIHAGSSWIDAFEMELRANGNYSDIGFTANQDGAMGDIYFKKRKIVYDPTLDDMGMAKRAYMWDSKDIFIMALEGDWKRTRQPTRPHNTLAFYQSMICTGQMVARRLNGAAVVDIA